MSGGFPAMMAACCGPSRPRLNALRPPLHAAGGGDRTLLMKIGSAEHKQRFCQQFVASHCRFDPATLAWPESRRAALGRLRGIPFWEEVLYTERRAARLWRFARTVADALVRERSHSRIRKRRVTPAAEGDDPPICIAAEERPLDEPTGADLRRAFADFGYGECLDSFLGLVCSRSRVGQSSCRSRV